MKKRIRWLRVLLTAGCMFSFILLMNCAVSADGTNYPDGWEIRYTTRNLCYVGSSEVVTVPASITFLDTFAFYGNASVKTLIVPATVETIRDYSIYNAPNLRTVIFYGNPSFTKYSIRNCPNLRNISVPKKGTYADSFAEKYNIPVKVGGDIGFPKSKVYLLKGDSCSQILCNSPLDPIAWKSSKKSVASVDSSGRVKAKKKGKTVITAITGNGQYRYTVQVYGKTVKDRVKQIKKAETISKKSQFERVKAVHGWMIRNIKYDYKNYIRGKLPKSVYTINGALIKKLCVCAGYAKAFKKLMTTYHVPCKYVTGRAGGVSHAWNMVKLGGKWYHVDVTWDDPIVNGSNTNTQISYDYFLKSTDYMRAHQHSFKTSSYPKCNSKIYDTVTSF